MQIKGAPSFSVVLRTVLFCSVVLRLVPQQSVVLHGTPSIIRCSVGAPSLIRSSIAPVPPVSVLLDVLKKHRKTSSFLKFPVGIERGTRCEMG